MPASGSGGATRLTLRSDARELRGMRQHLRTHLGAHDILGTQCDDLLLIANELATNAIEASTLGADITVELRVESSRITIAVENVGAPFVIPDNVGLPESNRLRGRGLALTARMADELRTERTAAGTRVIARWQRSAQPR